MFTPEMLSLFWTGICESLYMTLVSTILAYLFGLPLGVILCVTDKEGIRPMPWLNRILGNPDQCISFHSVSDSAGRGDSS